jgi:hypothetical protein
MIDAEPLSVTHENGSHSQERNTMQFLLDIDLTGAKPDVILTLLYACVDNNNTRFSYTGTAETIEATLDGSKLLTQAEYNAIIAFPYTLKFAQPPVPAPTPAPA